MKRFLVLTLFVSLVASALSGSPRDAIAADDTLSVNCNDGGVTSGRTFSNSVVGEDIVITNSSTTTDCVLVLANTVATAADTDDAGVADDVSGAAPNLVIEASGVVTLTIVASGTFVIESDNGGDDPQTFVIDACSLPGAGVESDPWLVSSPSDFQLIGDSVGTNSCVLSGYYLQTDDLVLTEYSADQVQGDFSGVYDGDHYEIELGGTDSSGWASGEDGAVRAGLFSEVSGIVKRLRLTGSMLGDNNGQIAGSLVLDLETGGLISEVSSDVRFVNHESSAGLFFGGLVGSAWDGTRVQYSSYSGSVVWGPDAHTIQATVGGLVGRVNGRTGVTGRPEIIDSYSRVHLTYDRPVGTTTTDGDPSGRVFFGGIVGVLDSDSVTIVRSYSAPSLSEIGELDETGVFPGGLVGWNLFRDLFSWSSFWLDSQTENAIGTNDTAYVRGGDQPDVYTDDSPGRPEAVPVSAAELSNLTTFQSAEGEVEGSPSGEADLPTLASTPGSVSAQDYRWAIEQGSVTTFVPSSYSDASDYTTRLLYTEPVSPATYQTRGSVATVTGYPVLGRVWEICSNENDGYPVLVWEERTCGSGSGGSSEGRDEEDSTSAASLGLTEAEYSAFLASGLTLEQWNASRLAATGPNASMLALVGSSAAAIAGLGALLLWLGRRERKLLSHQ